MNLDLYRPSFIANPYPTLHAMQAEGPVHDTSCGIRAICSYDEASATLRDPRWSVRFDDLDPVVALLGSFDGSSRSLTKLDGTEHLAVRRSMSPPFSSGALGGCLHELETIADSIVAGLSEREHIDLVSDVVAPLAARANAAFLDVPGDRVDELASLSRIVSQRMEVAPLSTEARSRHERATAQLRGMLLELATAETGTDGPLGHLASACVDGERLGDDDVAANAALLAMAAQEPTIGLVAGSLVALLERDRTGWRALADRPDLLDGAIDELIRLVSPVQLRPRVATTELSVGDHRFQPGEQVLVLIGAANHDPAVFPEPEQLELGRARAPHLGFGLGRHLCLGAPLARLEASVAIRTLLRHCPHLALATGSPNDDVTYEHRLAVRRPSRVEVRLR